MVKCAFISYRFFGTVTRLLLKDTVARDSISILFSTPLIMFLSLHLLNNFPISSDMFLFKGMRTATKVPFMYSRKGIVRPQSQFPHSCVWVFYIFPGSIHIFSCSRIGKPIVGIYKSYINTWTLKLGLRPHNSFYGNICFEFSVFAVFAGGTA